MDQLSAEELKQLETIGYLDLPPKLQAIKSSDEYARAQRENDSSGVKVARLHSFKIHNLGRKHKSQTLMNLSRSVVRFRSDVEKVHENVEDRIEKVTGQLNEVKNETEVFVNQVRKIEDKIGLAQAERKRDYLKRLSRISRVIVKQPRCRIDTKKSEIEQSDVRPKSEKRTPKKDKLKDGVSKLKQVEVMRRYAKNSEGKSELDDDARQVKARRKRDTRKEGRKKSLDGISKVKKVEVRRKIEIRKERKNRSEKGESKVKQTKVRIMYEIEERIKTEDETSKVKQTKVRQTHEIEERKKSEDGESKVKQPEVRRRHEMEKKCKAVEEEPKKNPLEDAEADDWDEITGWNTNKHEDDSDEPLLFEDDY